VIHVKGSFAKKEERGGLAGQTGRGGLAMVLVGEGV